jgi:hypothetical protein
MVLRVMLLVPLLMAWVVELIDFPLTWTSEKAAISFDCCVRSKSRAKIEME